MKLDAEGLIKLFDFGLTAWVGDAETLLHRGTEHYRAPELYDAGPVTLTPAADVYAFGVSAWQLSAGALPWQLRAMPTTSLPDSFGTHALGIPERVTSILDASISLDPAARPTSATIRATLQSQLLFGRHVGRAIWGLKVGELRLAHKTLRINALPVGEATLQYDGFEFSVAACTQNVSVNGIPAVAGTVLPESCVISIGAESLGAGRTHVTFDVSHPEVIV
jgi:serine/threonine-protein kinase